MTRGDEQHIQKIRSANISIDFIYILINNTAAEDCSIFKTKLIKKNIEKAKLGYKNVVNKAFFNHSLPYIINIYSKHFVKSSRVITSKYSHKYEQENH